MTSSDNTHLGGDKESMRRLEGIVASAMDAIITVNDAQRIVLFNPAAERMFGLSAERALGEHISRFIPERFREGHEAHIRKFSTTGDTNRQMGSLGAVSGLRTDGEEFPIEASISQVEIGGERLSTVILRDITERKAAEDALVESRKRMEGIVNSAMDALITVDENQRIILFNPAAERMFGVPADQALGAPIEQFIPERFRPEHAEHIRRFKVAGVTNRRMGALGAISGVRSNGEEFPIEASISQVEVGGAQLATVILRDIAERKSSEEARHLLAREVDHRAKNALAVVQSLVSLTRAPTKEAFIAAVRGRVSALGRAHSLLAQNRWVGGDLAQIVADEVSAYQRPGQVRVSGPGVLLVANAVQPISLVVHELAINAAKHGALSVEQGRVEVEWDLGADQALVITWRESGGPSVVTPSSKGFGSMLLAEVAGRQLRGSVEISWPPDGLSLRLTLPRTNFRMDGKPITIPPTEGTPERPLPSTGSVMIVEDEALIALELTDALTEMGWRVIGPAGTVGEGLQLLAEGHMPDVAVLDVNLGGELVYVLADRLQEEGVPIVFCTGYELIDREKRHSQSPVLRKPVNLDALARELARVAKAA